MRLRYIALALAFAGMTQDRPASPAASRTSDTAPPPGVRLEDLPWPEAEGVLRPDAVVVVPLGAAAKEHGPHLKLRNDLTIAEYLTRRVINAAQVVIAPTINYHFYPAFLEYPGSTSLTLATARDMTAEIIRSLAGYGPRRFYVLNTGISTRRPLEATARLLASEGILMHYTDLEARTDHAVRSVQQQAGGTHADEIETSMMLYIDPGSVDMTRAAKDYSPSPPGFPLTRTPGGNGAYSRTGIWGDATLATREKGRIVTEALVRGVLGDLANLRSAPLPQRTAVPVATQGMMPPPGRQAEQPDQSGCLPGDERTIRAIGPAFSLHWTNQDAEKLAGLWTFEGDIAHPDGFVERTSQVIRQNRANLFMRTEYRASRHFLGIGTVRCLTRDVAVADGKWDLREVVDANRKLVPPQDGLCTLVLKRAGGGWLIEAYRYTVTPRAGPPPSLLKQPGFLGPVVR
jgi:creatinine amidohydrolase